MKRVVFNYYGMQTCCNSKYHGASEYGKTVLKYLIENYNEQAEIVIIYNPIEGFDKWVDELLSKYAIQKHEIHSYGDLKAFFQSTSVDVFYSPTRMEYTIREIVGDKVLIKETLHDFRGIELIDDMKMIKYMSRDSAYKNLLKRCFYNTYRNKLIGDAQKDIDIIDRIYCISKHTFYSMNLLFSGVDNKKIKIYYSPAKTIPKIKNINDSPLNEKFILIIGGDRWTKNPYRTILAIDKVFSKLHDFSEYKAVVVGKVNRHLYRKISNLDRFIFSEYVETELLERYYANCEVFVYASLNEGFGAPPVEAMKYGTTCVLSGTTSIPEICGNAAYYVNPYDIHDIAEKITMALKERIDKSIVVGRATDIGNKQKDDLRKLCESILFD